MEEVNQGKVLFLTASFFLRSGNQSMLHTVRGWLENGYKAILITTADKNAQGFLTSAEFCPFLGDSLIVWRIQWVNKLIIFMKNSVFLPFRPLSKHLLKGKMPKNVLLNNQYNQWTSLPFWLLHSFALFCSGFHCLVRHKGVKVIYGYERWGILGGWLLHKFFRGKIFVTRFQGTSLCNFTNEGKIKWDRLPIDYFATLLKANKVIMANDGTNGKKVLTRLGHNPHSILFLPNGISNDIKKVEDAELLRAFLSENNISSESIVLTSISRLHYWKRVDRSIKILNKLVHHYGLNNLFLLILGNGPEFTGLVKLASDLNLMDNVKLLGAKPHKDIALYLQVSHMLWSFYDFSNLGNPVLEAVYLGIPVISIADGTTKGILDNSNSILIPDGKNLESRAARILAENINSGKIIRMKEDLQKSPSNKVLSWEWRMLKEVLFVTQVSGL